MPIEYLPKLFTSHNTQNKTAAVDQKYTIALFYVKKKNNILSLFSISMHQMPNYIVCSMINFKN